MKRLLVGGLLALGFAMTAAPAWADCYFECSCCRHFTFVRTTKNRCWSCTTTCNPLPCISSCSGGGCASAAPFPAPVAYAPFAYAPAAVAAAPAATTAPAASTPASQPSFQAPQPRPATSSTGVQQAGYFYYGQTNNAGYGYNAGYNYGTGYGSGYYNYGYAQAPNYWY